MRFFSSFARHHLRSIASRHLAPVAFKAWLLLALVTGGMGSVHAATVVQMATGSNSSAAVLSDGTLWTWGNGRYGQLGTGSTVSADKPVQIGSGFAQVAVGDLHMVGLKTDGTLWMWGVVGTARAQELAVTQPVQVGSGFAQLMTSETARKTDGSFWYWDNMKNLFNGNAGSDGILDRAPPGYRQMVSGRNNALFLLEDGAIRSVFLNVYSGDLFINPGWQGGYGNAGPVDRGFVQLALGSRSAAGVKEDGTLWQWKEREAPVLVGGGYRQVAKGSSHTVALKADGTAWAWGSNDKGQLGNGTQSNTEIPQPLGAGYAQVAASYSHSLALTTDGTLLAWGNNDYGQLGVGPVGPSQPAPVRVVFEGAGASGLGTMVAIGTRTRLTLTAYVEIQPEHLATGAKGNPYLVAITPDGTMYTYAVPNFDRLNPANPLAWADRLQNTSTVLFLNQDMTHLSGTAFFIGYGLGATTAESLGEMLNSFRYKRVYDIQ
ncbi:Regulator of chromosome condensation (RCC1) repeat containing protein [Acidovorax sp. CF316]|nr:Regulator of chromosome condensation (RCC1) repeat containing protein [Acidovorax sp. CF316]